ncbi:MAG: hypothetical protein J7M40_01070, partial [Planctomycetes bacterium]|nr:hypothetical protein [Planctomycetota bacterium]
MPVPKGDTILEKDARRSSREDTLMVSKIRIGFVGVGQMGQMAHLANYVTIEACQIVALAEVRPGLGKRVAERYGIGKVY